jgi:hypothetical protein
MDLCVCPKLHSFRAVVIPSSCLTPFPLAILFLRIVSCILETVGRAHEACHVATWDVMDPNDVLQLTGHAI